ncbi:hypothetical protein FGRMN_5536 [Fusarium graminum]|nr:hypothetical protein FGRMN_5536 [Fusarium graminum]
MAYNGLAYPEVEKSFGVDSSDNLLSHNDTIDDVCPDALPNLSEYAPKKSLSSIRKLGAELTRFANPGERSSQKRAQGTLDNSNRHGKRQRQRGRNPSDGAGGNGGSEDRKGNRKPDGARYPALYGKSPAKVLFECHFYKHDPARYEKCRGIRLSRVSDVPGHIMRQHLLAEVRLQPGAEADVANEDDVGNVTYCNKPKDIVFYCPRCRIEFFGPEADFRRDNHLEYGLWP